MPRLSSLIACVLLLVSPALTAIPVGAMNSEVSMHDASTIPSPLEVAQTVSVGSDPVAVIADAHNGLVYVVNRLSANVSVVNGTLVEATIPVAPYPCCGVYDNANGLVYVLSPLSRNITVINGTNVIGEIPVNVYADSIEYDPVNGYIYVVIPDGTVSRTLQPSHVTVIQGLSVLGTSSVGWDSGYGAFDLQSGWYYLAIVGENNVTIMNGTTVLGNVSVGTCPYSTAFSRASDSVYVMNSECVVVPATVSIVHGSSVVATLHVGLAPLFAVADQSNGLVYVLNSYSANISVLAADSVVGTIALNGGPVTGSYDTRTGLAYVIVGSEIAVIKNESLQGYVYVGSGAIDVQYDPINEAIYIANSGSNNISVLSAVAQMNQSRTGVPHCSTDCVALVLGSGVLIGAVTGAVSWVQRRRRLQ